MVNEVLDEDFLKKINCKVLLFLKEDTLPWSFYVDILVMSRVDAFARGKVIFGVLGRVVLVTSRKEEKKRRLLRVVICVMFICFGGGHFVFTESADGSHLVFTESADGSHLVFSHVQEVSLEGPVNGSRA